MERIKPTPAEQKAQAHRVAQELKRFEPGFIPEPLYSEGLRLWPGITIELVPLRIKDEKVEVLLIKRSPSDKFWPNELHVPGTMIRSGKDETFDATLERLFKDDLANTKIDSMFLAGESLHTTKRGKEFAKIYCTEIEGKPSIGKFYDVENLPEETVGHHRDIIIPTAVKLFIELQKLTL